MFQANMGERLQKGSLAQVELPNTIKDAIIFVRTLGERYLWIDALCIVQDDSVQIEHHIPRMDIIYRNAFANIIAISGGERKFWLAWSDFEF